MLELTVSDPPRRRSFVCAAVLFDMDGTLLDSRACVERIWLAWGAKHRLDLDELLRVAHGRQNPDTLQIMAPQLDAASELAALTRAQEDCRDGIVAVPGASRLLRSLAAGDWAVVTSAWRRLAEIRLGCAGLPLPAVLVTADDVRRSKPDPEGYLTAATRLGVAPEDCVVVEDAPAGIAAARTAGMRVVGVTTMVGRGPSWVPSGAWAISSR